MSPTDPRDAPQVRRARFDLVQSLAKLQEAQRQASATPAGPRAQDAVDRAAGRVKEARVTLDRALEQARDTTSR